MNLKLKEIKVDNCLAYKIVKARICCEQIKDCKFIDLYQRFDYEPQIAISQKTKEYVGDDVWLNDINYTKIEFCPFCGEKIIVDIVQSEDETCYYNQLQEREIQARISSRNTDSKAEKKSYIRVAQDYSEELNYYLTNDSIHMFIE
jgi:hypothetical protein